MQEIILETNRLFLRNWKEEDFSPFAQLNQDSEVMRYMPSTLSGIESKQWAIKMQSFIRRKGYGLFALEEKVTGLFIGYTGIFPVTFSSFFTPALEIAWRLNKAYWGKGYATEAAGVCLEGLNLWGLKAKIVSFTSTSNTKSEAVMKRIGLRKGSEFDHPKLDKGHPLSRHILYELERSDN